MREVFARVEVFQHGGGGFQVFGREGDGGVCGCDGGGEVGGLGQEGLVRGEGGGGRANLEGYYWGFEIAV